MKRATPHPFRIPGTSVSSPFQELHELRVINTLRQFGLNCFSQFSVLRSPDTLQTSVMSQAPEDHDSGIKSAMENNQIQLMAICWTFN